MRRLELLDYGRLVAALGVVGFHYLYNGINNGKVTTIDMIPAVAGVAKYGYTGVCFFFMISGYVIFFSASGRTPRDFAVSRVVRLYPAFWTAMVITSVFTYFWGTDRIRVHPHQFLVNLTMVPRPLGESFVDGVYWTLEYELFFYGAVLVLLLAGLRNRLDAVFLAWPFLILAARYAHLSDVVFLGSYYCWFAAGAVFAVLKRKPSWFCWPALAVSAYLCLRDAVDGMPKGSKDGTLTYSTTVMVLIVVVCFAFFALQHTKWGSALHIPGSRLAGAMTFPVYLVHAHIGYMVLDRFATNDNKLFLYPLLVLSVLCLAYALHWSVEKKLAAFWKMLAKKTVGNVVGGVDMALHPRRTRAERAAAAAEASAASATAAEGTPETVGATAASTVSIPGQRSSESSEQESGKSVDSRS